MKSIATKKVAGGKMITVKVDHDNVINNIEILGDFFLHPEDSLELIENSFLGRHVKEDRLEAINRIDQIVAHNGLELIGITSKTIVDTVKEAVE